RVSAISEAPTCFQPNGKPFAAYERRVSSGEIPTFRGHLLSEEDMRVREQILQFMTRFQVELQPEQLDDAKSFLTSLLNDGLVEVRDRKLTLTDRGRPFLRNACMFFDYRLRQRQPEARIFSQSL